MNLIAPLRQAPAISETQAISLPKDLRARPFRYLKDLAQCPAVIFSTGNVIYATFLGVVADVHIGGAGAFVIQTGITLFSSGLQMRATYQGQNFGAPSRIQAYANWATAAVLVTSAIISLATGETQKAAMTALPICTFGFWGKAHWDFANYLDRQIALKNNNKHPEEASGDPLLQKSEKRYLIAAGIADILAPFKNKPIDKIADIFKTLATDTRSLTLAQSASLAPVPFFIAGMVQSLFKKGPFNSNNAYSLGYAVATVAAIMSGDWLFAGAQALWSWGYRTIAISNSRPRPISADEYAGRLTPKPTP